MVVLAQSELENQSGWPKAVAVVADGVDEDIAYVVDIPWYHTLLVEVAVGHHAGGEEIVGDGVYNRAVDLTRHVHVERARAGYDVCYTFDPRFLATMAQLMVAVMSSTTEAPLGRRFVELPPKASMMAAATWEWSCPLMPR